MTPLDDELRRTLSDRAASVAPAPDPLAGVESRARGIRRRRTALSVSGAIAAVAAVAIAVPTLNRDNGAELQLGNTPTPAASASPTPSASPVVNHRPANVLRWVLRGKDAYSPDTLDLRRRFAQAFDRTDVDNTEYMPLFVDKVDGVAFTAGQVWFTGADEAYTVSYSVGPDNVPQFFLGPVTPTSPWGLAFLVTGMGNTDHDVLAVVPDPRVGQVSYDADATGPFTPADMPSELGGVALIDRDLQASDDRLEVLDGNGDLDHPMYRGPVTPLLCGLKECG